MEYSVFIDEAGDTGTDSEYYMLTLVFHNQDASLESNIAAYESRLTSASLPKNASMSLARAVFRSLPRVTIEGRRA